MTERELTETVTEAVGLFHSSGDMEKAIDDLLGNGFDRADISVLATEKSVVEKLGHVYVSVRELEDDPKVPTVAYVPREAMGDAEGAVVGTFLYIPAAIAGVAVVASGGALAAAISALAIWAGIGGAIGAMLAILIGQDHARQMEKHLERGGLLLWVRTRDSQHEERAQYILTSSGAEDVHTHLLPAYRSKLGTSPTAQ